jgi:tricorn protease
MSYVIKEAWRKCTNTFKEKLALNRWIFLYTVCVVGAAEAAGCESDRSTESVPLNESFRRKVALGGAPAPLGLGRGSCWLSYLPPGTWRAQSAPAAAAAPCVVGRHTSDPAVDPWKGYTGGAVGQLWIDRRGDGAFEPLSPLPQPGNVGRPLFSMGRIYFVSDFDAAVGGELYSCDCDGGDLTAHGCAQTHTPYYVRQPCAAADKSNPTLLYAAGGALYALDLAAAAAPVQLQLQLYSPRVGLEAYRVSAMEHLSWLDMHPDGLSLALASRGAAFTLGLYFGPAVQTGMRGPAEEDASCGRCRMVAYLTDGPWGPHRRLVAVVSDSTVGADALEVHYEDQSREPAVLPFAPVELGTITDVVCSPVEPLVALTNHRMELLLATVGDANDETATAVADAPPKGRHRGRRGPKAVPEGACRRLASQLPDLRRVDCCANECDGGHGIQGVAWSPCGSWIAYSFAVGPKLAVIKLLHVRSGVTVAATHPIAVDSRPAFDPDGAMSLSQTPAAKLIFNGAI